MPEINLTALDASLLAEIDEQLRDGLITKAEADKLRGAIQVGGSDEKPKALFSKSMAAKRERT